MSENNNHTVIRDGFEISPDYWGEENQEHAPDEVEPLSAAEKLAGTKKVIQAKQQEVKEQLTHPLNGIYGCP